MECIQAPITGTLWKFLVEVGDHIQVGEEVAILESMKMEIPIEAETGGQVTAIHCKEGDVVQEGDPLMELS